MRKFILLLLIVIVSFFFSFQLDDKPVAIPPSQQRIGDAVEGFRYLVTGDYLRSGIPYSTFIFANGKVQNDFLQRDSYNKNLGYGFTAAKASNGELVVVPNCLQCHAQEFDDKLIIGLGNTFIDFTKDSKTSIKGLNLLESFLKKTAPKKYEAAASFITASKTLGPYLYTDVQGLNAADRLAAILVAHRDPKSFAWSNEALLNIPDEVIPTDTPAWWLLKKKNAMFYNGFGRGDFGKFLMASNLLTVSDTSESRQIDAHAPDMLAYIYSIQAPKYPGTIDQKLAKQGEVLFQKNCSSCHGSYGANPSYPNLLIPESIIQTDPELYQSNHSHPQFVEWFNKSWYATTDHPAQLIPFKGYIAPPLDGVWITAPYLHNGSVPTLEALLNSKSRPTFWSRNFNQPQYDYEQVGWKYTVEEKGGSSKIYNSTLKGYSNAGHYFGDALTDAERKAVIEYLKTL
jgi:mono/diheme cytochrome c family protein